MFCPRCGAPRPEGAQFCPRCGAPVGPAPSGGVPPSPPEPSEPALLRANRLVLLWDKLALGPTYRFEDPSGTPLGETVVASRFPLELRLVDAQQQAVLALNVQRVRGVRFAFLVHAPDGTVLASAEVRSSVLSSRYAVRVGGVERMALVADATGHRYQLVDTISGATVATGIREPALRTSRTTIEIVGDPGPDHRVVLGLMLLLEFQTTRNA